MENCLLIFTRKPELGKVKTRLAHDIGDVAALRVYKYLLQHTANISKKVVAEKLVFYTNSVIKNDFWDDNIFKKHLQIPGDLGVKMKHAFRIAFENNYKKVIIIGSDVIDIDENIINRAYKLLDKKDAVVGPAKDGGYYLLGLKQLEPSVFENKPWGTDKVLNLTLKDLQHLDIGMLEIKNDIDYLDDLLEFPELIKLIEK